MNMKKLILISVVIHAILIAVLAPVIKTRMEFDEKEEVQRTADVKKREAERKEKDRLRREKQKLDEKTAKLLKKEAEFRKKKEIKQQVKELRKKRDEMVERRDKELEKLREREKSDVIAREKAAMKKIVSKIQDHVNRADDAASRTDTILARYPNENSGALNGVLDDLKISKRIWTDTEIANEAASLVSSDYLWDFENGAKESLNGREVSLSQSAKIVPREDGEGFMLDVKGSQALAKVGPVNYGEKFTIAVSVKLESNGDKDQVILTNGHSGNYNRSIRFLVNGKDGEGKVIFRTTGKNATVSESSTSAGAFPFGKWVRVVVTTDVPEDSVRIFIDGVEMELAESELADEVTTTASDLSDLKKLTEENLAKMNDKELDPSTVPEMLENLDDILEKIAEEMKEEQDNHAARNEMANAAQDINEAKDALAGLDAKTDMEQMNDTSTADAEKEDKEGENTAGTDAEKSGSGSGEEKNAAEMYKEAEGLEKEIAEAKSDMDAAGEAVSQNSSFADAKKKSSSATPSRPDLASALGGGPPGTVGALNDFRDSLNQAENEMQDMNARADAALGRSAQNSLSASSFASSAARSSAAAMTSKFGQVVSMTGFGNSEGDGDSTNMRMDESGDGAAMTYNTNMKALQLDEGKIISAAMPGRRFTESSLRKGWLYLDTWYVIGPWENNSIVDYTVKHPPEFGIDFDAKYYDGKFADKPGHPYETLKWEFYQSDQVRNQPPAVYGASTYYAYTDVWFEEARDMLIAVASDDASSVWLNGQIVWQDVGQSSWQLGEGYRKVHFNQGFNDVLVRIENGPTHCVWSVVLCPPEMLGK